MKIKYFPETDTVYFQLTEHEVFETKELNENTTLDLDSSGNLVAITLEHAQSLATISELSFQQMNAVA
jgi:uncharacterized protein YuzE